MLSGKLKTFSLSTLLQMCYNESNTGALEFRKFNQLYGKIEFEEGAPVYADFIGLYGLDAVKQLSILQDLEFNFNDKAERTNYNIEMDINFLIIECSKFKDECLEHLTYTQDLLAEKYSVVSVNFFEYDNVCFNSPFVYNINFLELSDNGTYYIVFLDKALNIRIKIVFDIIEGPSIFTNDLLMFLQDKEMLA
mgnify:CR=1 FL=1